MIEVYAPFVLIMMSWNAADPAGTMEVSQRLFIDQATCIAAGDELDDLLVTADLNEGTSITWRCVEQARDIEVFRPENSGK
jgi:hypothetical protein